MIKVLCEYINEPSKTGNDYFIYTNIEVQGHADKTGYTTNIKVCAGVSACCYGINRLLTEDKFNVVYDKGYFHVWTDRRKDLKNALDKESVYALNTLVCQLYEIYREYPSAFKKFDLVDVKEKIKNDEQRNEQTRTRTRKKRNRMGLYSLIEGTHSQEN